MKKVAKIVRKVKAIALLFGRFLPLSKMEKVAKIGRKVKVIIALLFGRFLPLFQK
jgi:nicotinamide mononucleotide adenylyltransferase